jgi:Uma2 family endonuclease
VTEVLAKAPGPWTSADLATTPDDGQRYEIVDGSLLVSPPPTVLHQAVTARISRLLAAAAGPELEVLEGVGVQLANGLLVPDVVVADGAAVWSGRSVLTPADLLLAVEVVSPSSTTTDRVTKPALYAAAGVPAYWRVELEGVEGPTVVTYRLSGTAYAEQATVTAAESVRLDWPLGVHLAPADWRPATDSSG